MCTGRDGSPLDISVSREWLTPMRLRESETIESEPRPHSPPPSRKSDLKREHEVGERGENTKKLKKSLIRSDSIELGDYKYATERDAVGQNVG